jgi:hypothetical protein
MIILDASLPHGIGQLGVQSGPRVLARTESLRTQSGTIQAGARHDHWTRLDVVRCRSSQHSPVMIALFSMEALGGAPQFFFVMMLSDSSNGGLVQLFGESDSIALDTYFVYPEELKTVARVQVFRDFLVTKAQRWHF